MSGETDKILHALLCEDEAMLCREVAQEGRSNHDVDVFIDQPKLIDILLLAVVENCLEELLWQGEERRMCRRRLDRRSPSREV